jgi:hypothetical protein
MDNQENRISKTDKIQILDILSSTIEQVLKREYESKIDSETIAFSVLYAPVAYCPDGWMVISYYMINPDKMKDDNGLFNSLKQAVKDGAQQVLDLDTIFDFPVFHEDGQGWAENVQIAVCEIGVNEN